MFGFSLPSLVSFFVLFGIVRNSDAFVTTTTTAMTTLLQRSSSRQSQPQRQPHQQRGGGRGRRSIIMPRYFQDDTSDGDLTFAEQERREWIHRSMAYYSKVRMMREEQQQQQQRRKQQVRYDYDDRAYPQEFSVLAKKHYFALRKIKDGKPNHAEEIYRRIIAQIQNSHNDNNNNNNNTNNKNTVDEPRQDCDHSPLAVTTLLLALHLQRTGAPAKRTRSVFLNFFRQAMVENKHHHHHHHPQEKCACSAKVLQAFALFEMKQGNKLKSLQLVQMAVQLDHTLQPVLQWKQFRDAYARVQQKGTRNPPK